MDINQHNYEEFVLDYLENNLSESQHQSMVNFLDKNQHIKKEIEDLLDYRVTPKEQLYSGKKELLQSTKSTAIYYNLAAVLALVFASIFVFLNRNEQPQSPAQPSELNQKAVQPLPNDDNDDKFVEQNNDSNEVKQSQKQDLKLQPEKVKENVANAQQPIIIQKNAPTQVDNQPSNYVNSQPDSKPVVNSQPNKIEPKEDFSPNKYYKKEVAPQKAENLAVNEDKTSPKKSAKQSKIDSILKANEDKESFAEEKQNNDGFKIESHPKDDDLYVKEGEEDGTKPDKQKKKGILKSIFDDGSDEIKKAITPRSYGLNEDEKRPPVNPEKTAEPLPNAGSGKQDQKVEPK